jgi:uncharacterized protein
MSDQMPVVGRVAWRDLTVPNAEEIRDFYSAVVGWSWSPVDMDAYDDYNMTAPSGGEAVAGICHARGVNAKLPPQWLMYVAVEDVDESARRCRDLGGAVVDGPRPMGRWRFAVIRDPAGAYAALLSE